MFGGSINYKTKEWVIVARYMQHMLYTVLDNYW